MILVIIFCLHLLFDLLLDSLEGPADKGTTNTSTQADSNKEVSQTSEQKNTKPAELVEKETALASLVEEIKQLKEEGEKYNNPSDYAKYSKTQRKIISLEKKYQADSIELQRVEQAYQSTKVEESQTAKPEIVEKKEEKSKPAHHFIPKKKIIVRLLRIALPLFLYFMIPNESLSIKMDSTYLNPVAYALGTQEGKFFSIGRRLAWVVFCYRAINRMKRFTKDIILKSWAPAATATAPATKLKQE